MESPSSRVERLVKQAVANGEAIRRYAPLIQAALGVALIGLGAAVGHEHLHLILDGERTTGRIVGAEQRDFSDHTRQSLSNIGYMPVVEFQVGDRTVRFTNWMGSRHRPVNGTTVTVFYAADDPARAMIDRAGLNWIPWAPLLAVGVFLVVVALKGWAANVRKRTSD